MIYITKKGDVLDLLCYQLCGSHDNLEEVLNANPQLANLGCVLPEGIEIEFKEAQQAVASTKPSISLWD